MRIADTLLKEKINKTSTLAFFIIYCSWPVCFYFCYVHCGAILKHQFVFAAGAIIKQNFFVSIVQCIGYLFFALLSYRIHPLKILKYKALILFPFIVVCPFLLSCMTAAWQLMVIQSFVVFFAMTAAPAMPIFIKKFPVFNRFTYTSFIYALTRALMYVVTSFGLVYLTELFGHQGLWIIMIPCAVGFIWGVIYFERLEKPLSSSKILKTAA
jgi:hypothetical protein